MSTTLTEPNNKPALPRETIRQSMSSRKKTRGNRGGRSLLAKGEPMLWLTGGGLIVAVVMIIALLALVIVQGMVTFWPKHVDQFVLKNGTVHMGEITRDDTYKPEVGVLDSLPAEVQTDIANNEGWAHRELVRTGNFDLTNSHFHWVEDFYIESRSQPQWATVIERNAWGRFYGMPKAFMIDGKVVADTPEGTWAEFLKHHDQVRERWHVRRALEKHDIGYESRKIDDARLELKSAKIEHGVDSPQYRDAQTNYDAVDAEVNVAYGKIREKINALNAENDKYQLVMVTTQGQEKQLGLADVVRAYQPNQIGFGSKLGIYVSRWWEFLTDEPREANSEGGVFPAIFGTVAMTLIMSLMVVPFGVLASLYLREYAKAGPMISAVRIAINNLAGVPSIVFGVFGLGFFCYVVGGTIDEVFFKASLPNPTFGTGGLLWAALTLALLTLPVVIVSTEEALAAVPGSMREGSYGCGASKWQTIRRIVLPRAMPGVMTGAILAMARGAGEVAPLMLVGAVKLAPELPIDGVYPFLHAQRSFMHLGFHVYDLGFQSQNAEAAKPMVFTTTLLLIMIVAFLNLFAIWLRARLRRKFVSSQF
ncbi:MAG TPA: phosphate ABC transporter permease PtsA [Phycisphaerales bacterium]|nr:phosphate ABC transporter permease PtsA [Phycisphaerales bacterium]|tara:strand:- start:1100 stop:2875 length:1776 start_codon:yes stop_codon:yes gene_type:complete